MLPVVTVCALAAVAHSHSRHSTADSLETALVRNLIVHSKFKTKMLKNA
jgi:hypothetical protein